MVKLTKESFIKSLKEMNIKEVMELVDAMKEEFGIDPTTFVTTASPTANAEEEKAVKSKVSVTMKTIGGNKVSVIKVIKEITGVGLMDAKKLSESAPVVIKENIKIEEAEEIKTKLEEAGAEIEIA